VASSPFKHLSAALVLGTILWAWTVPLFAAIEGSASTFDAITLERTPCYGTCPVYRVEVSSDGMVKYEGKSDVAVKGLQTHMVSSSDIDFLREAIKRIHFSELRSTYENSNDGCKEVWTDMSTITIQTISGSSRKKVIYYVGCRGLSVLGRIAWLADTIDEVAGTARWVGPRMFGSK